VESRQFRSAATAGFPDSVAALLYKNFLPSTQGTPLMTLRDYVTNGQFSGSGFSSFAQYLCPGSLDPNGFDPPAAAGLSNRFAQLFGVEQADIDQMNGAPNQGAVWEAHLLHCLRWCCQPRRYVSGTGDQQQQVASEGNLFNGNEASLRLDFQPGFQRPAVRPVQLARSTDQYTESANGFRGFLNPSKVTTPISSSVTSIL